MEEEEEVAYLCSFHCPLNLYIPNMSIQAKLLRINPRRRRQSNRAQLQKTIYSSVTEKSPPLAHTTKKFR